MIDLLWIFLALWGFANFIMVFIDFGEDLLPLVPSDLDDLNLFGQIVCYILIWLLLPLGMLERVIRFLFTM